MLIGIVTDIHDPVSPLRAALTALRQCGVEQVVTLGDAFDSCRRGEPGVEVATLLHEADAIGVWGNHDAGLSHEVPVQVRAAADPALPAFAAHLQPQLTLEGCRFSHIEPWRNACRAEDLWAFDRVPDTVTQAERSFAAVSERVIFVGHFHVWLAMRRFFGRMPWNGCRPITLTGPDRYLVAVAPTADGWCATLDTEQSELTPIPISG